MKTYSSFLLSVSAVFMASLGLAATFAPLELAHSLGESGPLFPLLLQVGGALYLGFAMLNSLARTSLIGGIYNRPLLLANLLHFVVAALALVRPAMSASALPVVRTAAVLYALFAIGFSALLFRSPVLSAPES
jgi:hypothetical protein